MRSVAVELDRHRIKPVPSSTRAAEGPFAKEQIVLNPSAI